MTAHIVSTGGCSFEFVMHACATRGVFFSLRRVLLGNLSMGCHLEKNKCHKCVAIGHLIEGLACNGECGHTEVEGGRGSFRDKTINAAEAGSVC